MFDAASHVLNSRQASVALQTTKLTTSTAAEERAGQTVRQRADRPFNGGQRAVHVSREGWGELARRPDHMMYLPHV